jgi:hypothetical protein
MQSAHRQDSGRIVDVWAIVGRQRHNLRAGIEQRDLRVSSRHAACRASAPGRAVLCDSIARAYRDITFLTPQWKSNASRPEYP